MDGTYPHGSTHPATPTSVRDFPPLAVKIVYPDDLQGQTFELADGLTVGRMPGASSVQLAQRTVSARHAHFSAGNGFWLSDLGSTNGTRVNGEPVRHQAYLVPQTIVRFGDVIGVVDEPGPRQFGKSSVLPGTHTAHARILDQLPRTGRDATPVLISGETGTGKERVALEVHRLSGRTGNCIPINCAELSLHLIESQLFGHERGAFTGAVSAQTGLFEAAHGGTLFLDEIGELPLDLQPKLLRALQEGEIRPVGSVRTRPVDVRIVAATNQDLSLLVERGKFRRDLYARLSLWDFHLPPLRQARQDLLPWIHQFLLEWNAERGSEASLVFQPDAAERILLHKWRDNLRGLVRLVHRLATASPRQPIGVRLLQEVMPEFIVSSATPPDQFSANEQRQPTLRSAPPNAAKPSTSVRPSREEFLEVYQRHGCSIRATSKHFGKERRQIYRWLDAFGIDRDPSTEDDQ